MTMKKMFKRVMGMMRVIGMMMLAAALCFGACDDGSSSSMPDAEPAAVSGLTAATAADHVTLAWTDPSNPTFDHIEITWTPGVPAEPVNVDPGVQTCDVAVPADGTARTFTVTSVFEDTATFGATIDTTGEAEIYTAADLDNVRNNLAAHYILMADIDLGLSPYNDGQGWEPIGRFSKEGTPFSGVFNGNGHAISNLTVNSESVYGVGLFGYLDGQGVVSDLALVEVNIRGEGCGGLAYHNAGAVRYCSVSGSVSGISEEVVGLMGGLVGTNQGEVSDCQASVNVSGTNLVGGLVGANGGTVSDCHATGVVSGENKVGGLAGMIDSGTVSGCYATGTVSGTDEIGGLAGFVYESTVSDCYATGSVSGSDQIGGLVGRNMGTVSFCYAIGAVSGTNYVGGLIGENTVDAGTVDSGYYDSQTTGQSDTGKGEPRTTAQMKLTDTSVATYAGWDFTGETANGTADTWSIDTAGVVNSGYPYLTGNH